MQQYTTAQARIDKFKGQILKRAAPKECLVKIGRQVEYSPNMSGTYIARRWLPYGATSTSASTQNRFFANGTGDRGNVMAQAHQIAEGITPTPDTISPVDFTATMQQYGCLYAFSDKLAKLYEDNIPKEMVSQVADRFCLVREMVSYGAYRGCTNQFYGGVGTTVATVNGGLTLGLLRTVQRNLQANHAVMITSMLKASQNYGTDAVSPGYVVYCHTNLEPDVRDLAGYTPTERYGQAEKAMQGEIGKIERFRFVSTPDMPELQDAGAAVGSSPNMTSTTASNIDVYPVIVMAEDAVSHIAIRGLNGMDATFIPHGRKEKSDALGQRGYAGASWWDAVLIENPGWMAIVNVGLKTLTT